MKIKKSKPPTIKENKPNLQNKAYELLPQTPLEDFIGPERTKELKLARNFMMTHKDANKKDYWSSLSYETVSSDLLSLLHARNKHGVSMAQEILLICSKKKPEMVLNFIKDMVKTEKQAQSGGNKTQVFAPVIITTPDENMNINIATQQDPLADPLADKMGDKMGDNPGHVPNLMDVAKGIVESAQNRQHIKGN
jgi:hypothetical protein